MGKMYVVEADTDLLGRTKIVYAGDDPDVAAEVCGEHTKETDTLHAFIEVWEDGEFQYVTRERSSL